MVLLLQYSMEKENQTCRLPSENQNSSKPSVSDQKLTKVESEILSLNTKGMAYLNNNQPSLSLQCLRKAYKTIQEQAAKPQSRAVSDRVLGITLNNLGCYYNKIGKPRVALSYLKNALKVEVDKVLDWASTAETHLNICATYSLQGKHKDASQHAQMAIKLLERELYRDYQNQVKIPGSKVVSTLVIAWYNLGVESQYLKDYRKSKQAYQAGLKLTSETNVCRVDLVQVLRQCLKSVYNHIESEIRRTEQHKSKLEQQELSGHYSFMRRHKHAPLAKIQSLTIKPSLLTEIKLPNKNIRTGICKTYRPSGNKQVQSTSPATNRNL